jgi:hypothetical protein
MAITVYTDAPQALLNQIKDDARAGALKTWEMDDDQDFTHTPQQWLNQAFMRGQVSNQRLYFWIIGRKAVPTTKVIYAVYHARFSEMLLTRYDRRMVKVEISSLATNSDRIT